MDFFAKVEAASAGTLVAGFLLCTAAEEAPECGIRMFVDFTDKMIAPSLRSAGDAVPGNVAGDLPRTRVTTDFAAAEWAKAQRHLKRNVAISCHVPSAGLL